MDTPDASSSKAVPVLVSFSGIDGAGKTTQIENLVTRLEAAGLRVRVIRFWDEIAAFRRLRETVGHTVFRGEKGVGAPGRPVQRRDKNVRSWYMLPVRIALCLMDTMRLMFAVARVRRQPQADVVIFDRYIFDQFANLYARNAVILKYLELLLRLAPRPDVAFLLDAEPEFARSRKPEYPIAFLITNRACYLTLSKIAGMVVICPGTPVEVEHSVCEELSSRVNAARRQPLRPFLTSTSD